MDYLISAIIGGGTALAVMKLFSEKLLSHTLNKKLESYKFKMQALYNIEFEKKKTFLKNEEDTLKMLWDKFLIAYNIYATFSNSDRDKLIHSTVDLEKFIYENEIYLCDDILRSVGDLVTNIDPEKYCGENFSEIEEIRRDVVSAYKKHLIISS